MIKLKLDATALKKSYCPLLFKRLVIEGYRSPVIYNDTQYGTAVHRFIAVMYYTGGNFEVAIREALSTFKKYTQVRARKDHLNENHLVNTCLRFWEDFISKDDFELVINPHATCWKCKGAGELQIEKEIVPQKCPECQGKGERPQPLVEVNFDIPFYKTEDIEINICGTIDRIGKFKNGCFAIRDWKSTSSYDIKGYFRQYLLSPQFFLYVWALKRFAKDHPDSPLAEICNTPVGVCIDGIFLKSAKETTFASGEVFVPKKEMLDEFEKLLASKANSLIVLSKHNPMKCGIIEGTCHSMFPCPFFDVCAAPDEIAANHILKNNFTQKDYNPLTFNED